MKVLMINVVCGIRSTGRICTDLAVALKKKGHEVKIAYGRECVPKEYQKYAVRIETDLGVKIHGIKARLLDAAGFGSRTATMRFVNWIREFDPDIIHLHNIHGYYINIEVLFNYLKNSGKKVIWTMHDCWAFTGHAAYCEGVDCERWILGCKKCKKLREYPKSLFDFSKRNWKRKKLIFTGLNNLTIVTPSQWLSNLISKSYLHEYPIEVIHNGIDTTIFRPYEKNKLDNHSCNDYRIVLGVASPWSDRKGLKDFIMLSELLPDEYRIMLVGLSKEQLDNLPNNIIGINRTDSSEELAQIYSSAEVFVNPTYEDNYPTTNIEAIACGTPVITYNTGGSVECVNKENIVAKGDVEGLRKVITEEKYTLDINQDVSKEFMLSQYLELYQRMK